MTTRPAGALPASIAVLHPDRWTAPFWEGATKHRLLVAQCDRCQTFRMPPRAFCPVCGSQEVSWVELSGRGTVYTFTVVRHAVIPVVRDSLPYVIAVVELDGAPGARLVGNVLGIDPEAVTVGLPVEVVWDDLDDGVSIPRFAPADHDG